MACVSQKKTRKVLGPENFSVRFFFLLGLFSGGFLGSRKAFLKETRILTHVFGIVLSGL